MITLCDWVGGRRQERLQIDTFCPIYFHHQDGDGDDLDQNNSGDDGDGDDEDNGGDDELHENNSDGDDDEENNGDDDELDENNGGNDDDEENNGADAGNACKEVSRSCTGVGGSKLSRSTSGRRMQKV